MRLCCSKTMAELVADHLLNVAQACCSMTTAKSAAGQPLSILGNEVRLIPLVTYDLCARLSFSAESDARGEATGCPWIKLRNLRDMVKVYVVMVVIRRVVCVASCRSRRPRRSGSAPALPPASA